MQLREERHPHETRLLSELRHVQSRHMRPTASHRLDGYTSDTTAFADDDEDYSIPLHINTVQKKGFGKERPFMQIKRAHERYAQVQNLKHKVSVVTFKSTHGYRKTVHLTLMVSVITFSPLDLTEYGCPCRYPGR